MVRKLLLPLILGFILAFIAYRAANPPEPEPLKQSEYERRCKYLGHDDPAALKDCIWSHRAQEMAKWRQIDWDRWKVMTGATGDEVLRQQAAIWLEIERQKKSGVAPSRNERR